MIQLDETVAINVLPADDRAPAGKLADVELHFTAGALEGLKLLGFTVWEGRDGKGPSVSLPSRNYVVNGERRSFTLLRPTGDTPSQSALRDTTAGCVRGTGGVVADRRGRGCRRWNASTVTAALTPHSRGQAQQSKGAARALSESAVRPR